MRNMTLPLLLSGVTLLVATPAQADDLASATSSIDIACAGITSATSIKQAKLAEVTLVVAGLQPSELLGLVKTKLGRPPSGDELSATALLLVRDTSLLPKAVADQVDAITATMANNLTYDDGLLIKKLVVRGVRKDQSPFEDGLELICPGKTELATIDGAIVPREDKEGHGKGENSFVLRAKLEDATVASKDASGSFQGSYARTRSTDLDGETNWTKTIAVQGVAALRVAGDSKSSYLYGYGDYALNQVRKRSAPTPTPEEKDGSKDDVNALEVGAYASAPIGISESFILRSSVRAGGVFDFEHGARRLVAGFRFQPVLSTLTIGPAKYPLCGVGFYSDSIFGLPLEARCTGALRADASEVLKAGSAELTAKDEILALGGELGFEFRPPLRGNEPGDGLVGGVTYRYQQTVAGDAPSIDRLDLTLKYRWWINKLAVDFGLTFADGIETKSFADENKFGVTLGILY